MAAQRRRCGIRSALISAARPTEPAAALSDADIFFYPLQPDHYGTAENVLVEAMSLGLAPVVLNNPAEMAIVRDSKTGFIAQSIEECVSLLQTLLSSPEVREKISRNAIRHVAETRTPAHSARDFMILWLGLLSEPTRHCNFRAADRRKPGGMVSRDAALAGREWTSANWKTRNSRRRARSRISKASLPAMRLLPDCGDHCER